MLVYKQSFLFFKVCCSIAAKAESLPLQLSYKNALFCFALAVCHFQSSLVFVGNAGAQGYNTGALLEPTLMKHPP
jgi:hypothetical protein